MKKWIVESNRRFENSKYRLAIVLVITLGVIALQMHVSMLLGWVVGLLFIAWRLSYAKITGTNILK